MAALACSHQWDLYLVSLVPICCRDSSLSWSDCMGRMFLSSRSLSDGRLLSLMASESFLNTFIASVPTHKPGKPRDPMNRILVSQRDLGRCDVTVYFLWLLPTFPSFHQNGTR